MKWKNFPVKWNKFSFAVKPRIIEQFNNDDVENGTSYKLNCTAYGDPILTYSWRLNGKWKIPNSYKTERNKTLVIHPFKLENQGIYMCFVENVEGNASTIANITVFGKFWKSILLKKVEKM